MVDVYLRIVTFVDDEWSYSLDLLSKQKIVILTNIIQEVYQLIPWIPQLLKSFHT